MASPDSKDEAMRDRIVSHMNKDHKASLVRYLEHYKKVPSAKASNAEMVNMTLDSMVIAAGGTRYVIALEPPMKNLGEARERAVKMDKESLAGLGRSDITITEYTRPRGFHAVVFWSAFLTFVLYSRRANWEPGFFLYDRLWKHVPPFAALGRTLSPWLCYGMIALHGFEVTRFIPKRMTRHNVPAYSKLWWQWVSSCFIEGVCAFQRTQWQVDRKQREKDAKKH